MHVVHLTASTFFGGPERQMLGLAGHLPPRFVSTFLSFPEGGCCAPFLIEARKRGYTALPLAFDTPKVRDAVRELTFMLRSRAADLLVTHTFKPNVLGRVAARRVGIPHVVVSRGWTGETLRVRMYEAVDRFQLKYADRVVAVSEGQAERVRRCGVRDEKLTVIRNAARPEAFAKPLPGSRDRLEGFFPGDSPVSHVVLAAGRLSPEKGFDTLVTAAAPVIKDWPRVGFVLFGEGPQRAILDRRIRQLGLGNRFVMPGFVPELDAVLPAADLVVLPSFSEGLPNVALEAAAAGVPVVASAVGGVPEVVADGETGLLVPPGDADILAGQIVRLLTDHDRRVQLGRAARVRMQNEFTFAAQARQYVDLFDSVRQGSRAAA
ncbi:MAG TPA: glycosyltransferase family 4 protein [Fimbriiglobus sp.]|jgi:glycosyltransferase involved in cell wall biosynthesis